ncbi:NAD kinase [Granulicoccus sp. GXG6511]|uniref:NAD kinase n=1 Tax=Granulicoccus sp. GXG6511 TaxID=3381351 RepID=UPI003D7C9F8D
MLSHVRTPETCRRVAVLTHIHRPEAVAAACRFISGMTDQDIACLMPPADIDAMGAALDGLVVQPLSEDLPAGEVEVAVVFGGDGTILRGAEWAMPADVPLLGVNLGHVGFLAEAESWEIDQVVAHVVSRGWTMEERFVVEVVVRDRPAREGGREIWRSFAVNEVSIEKAARERMLELLIAVDDRPLHRWACDGVLVATPTGSTAYTFSAGGPVIWPELDALLVVPLSAHALFARPLVLGPQSTVTCQLVDTAPENSGVVWCDGRRSVDLRGGMEIEVSAGPHRLRMARLGLAPFTDRLVRKFGLRVEGWRGAAEARNNRAAGQQQP